MNDMPSRKEPTHEDLLKLDESSRSVHGYFVHRWFHQYLVALDEALRELYGDGLILGLTRPTERGRRMLFDFRMLDLHPPTYLVGIYLYVYLCHKNANRRLMGRFDGKQVLLLRGYDFEGAIKSEVGTAAGFYTTDSKMFSAKLRNLLDGEVALFKVASPMDLWWEMIDGQRYFDGAYDGMQRLIRQRPASVYLNALRWQEDVAHLLDRMDHFVVYVSSITESVIWELQQLDTKGRRGRVTVVFDEEAIADKEGRKELPGLFAARSEWQVAWTKEGKPPNLSAAEFRRYLSKRFLVATPEGFEADIERHLARIDASSSRCPPGERETWIDFCFHPAVGPDRLAELSDTATGLEELVIAATRDEIDSLPLFLAHVQLWICVTLLLGRHDETGRALAAYAGIMHGALEYFGPPGDRTGALSTDNRDHLLEDLREHRAFGRHAGLTLLSLGKSHEFESIVESARQSFNITYDATTEAMARFFALRGDQAE